MSLEELVEKASKRLPGVDKKEIEEKLRLLIEEFRVPEREALRSVITNLSKQYKIEVQTPTVKINELDNVNGEVKITFKVLGVREIKSEKVKYRLTIGDETGHTTALVLKGVKKEFEPGKVYTVKGAYKGESLLITKGALIFEEETDLDVPPLTYTGVIVSITNNSGIVPRCPECGGVMKKGLCSEHGKVKPKGSYEARIAVDDGKIVRNVTVRGKELVELSGLPLKEAAKIRTEYDNDTLNAELASRLIGRYVKVTIRDGEAIVERLAPATQTEVVA